MLYSRYSLVGYQWYRHHIEYDMEDSSHSCLLLHIRQHMNRIQYLGHQQLFHYTCQLHSYHPRSQCTKYILYRNKDGSGQNYHHMFCLHRSLSERSHSPNKIHHMTKDYLHHLRTRPNSIHLGIDQRHLYI
jgi:hypothetical protein